MPVLSEGDVLEERRDSVDWFNDRVSARNGQLPAGTEVVLYVDDYEDVLWGALHKGQGCCSIQFVFYLTVSLRRSLVRIAGHSTGTSRTNALSMYSNAAFLREHNLRYAAKSSRQNSAAYAPQVEHHPPASR